MGLYNDNFRDDLVEVFNFFQKNKKNIFDFKHEYINNIYN